MGGFVKLLKLAEAAKFLDVSEKSLSDARYLNRIRLPRVKIGKSVRFLEEDLERIVRRGRETLPQMPKEGFDVSD